MLHVEHEDGLFLALVLQTPNTVGSSKTPLDTLEPQRNITMNGC